MARIFITGSADGLGLMAAKSLLDMGHQVVLHARNAARGGQALDKLKTAENVLIADLADTEETKNLAAEVNFMEPFDAIIHNAGVYQVPGKTILAVNTIAPYLLTTLIKKPKRLIYLSSGMHLQGDASLTGLASESGRTTYSDSKLHVVLLAKAVARKWTDVYYNAMDPGWVPTKMGGAGAPDNLEKGFQTQVWLAVSDDDRAKVSGQFFYHQKQAHYLKEADDVQIQDKFLLLCEKMTGVKLT